MNVVKRMLIAVVLSLTTTERPRTHLSCAIEYCAHAPMLIAHAVVHTLWLVAVFESALPNRTYLDFSSPRVHTAVRGVIGIAVAGHKMTYK